MSKYDYDLFVIGAGSGDVRVGRMASSFGAKVAICDDRYMGGTCVSVGMHKKTSLIPKIRTGQEDNCPDDPIGISDADMMLDYLEQS